jgi:hypothetical protein
LKALPGVPPSESSDMPSAGLSTWSVLMFPLPHSHNQCISCHMLYIPHCIWIPCIWFILSNILTLTQYFHHH